MILPLFNGIFVTFQAHGLIEFWDNRVYRSNVISLKGDKHREKKCISEIV